MLWLAGKPWPVCTTPHPVQTSLLRWDPASQSVIPTAAARPSDRGGLMPVLQLHRRDVPALPWPADRDVLQLLWCPYTHVHETYTGPSPSLFWQRSTDLRTAVPSVDDGGDDGFRPAPCALFPEPCRDLPSEYDLRTDLGHRDLLERIHAWETQTGDRYRHAATVPGTKAGGWPKWGQDPFWPPCPSCDGPTTLLISITSTEFGGDARAWTPRTSGEEITQLADTRRDAGLSLSGDMMTFVCRQCANRPAAFHMW